MVEPAFIPKTIQVPMSRAPLRGAFGVLPFLGTVLLLLALVTLGGVFFYRELLERQAQGLQASLQRLEADFDPPLVQELSRVSRRIEASKNLLNQHHIPSGVFQFLEENTLPEVRFTNFSFDVSAGSLNMSGEAKSYTALAHQDAILRKNPSVRRFVLANFSLQPNGNIGFLVEISFVPQVTSPL